MRKRQRKKISKKSTILNIGKIPMQSGRWKSANNPYLADVMETIMDGDIRCVKIMTR
jgi:hypothetical protein